MADCLNNEEQVSSSLESANQDNLNSNLDADNAISSNISSDAIMVSNADAGETISSTLADDDTLESPLDLPVAHTYGGAETDNIVVTVNNNTYKISASLKPIKFKSLSDFPEVGSERLIYIDSSENSLYGWDSESLSYYKLTAGGDAYDDSELRGLIRNLETGKVDKVEGKDLSTHDFTEAYKSKLDGIESGAEANTVDSVNGQTGEVKLTFSDVNAPSTDQFNDFKTATETSIENIVNNTTKVAGTNGGFSAGTGSKMLGSDENSGGGAIGVNAQAYSGGAVGLNARASDGFAGGKDAKVGIAGSEDETVWTYVDAVQLGAGNNTQEKTLQVYDDNIYNAKNHALTVKNIVLDGENLKNTLDKKVENSELTFVSYNEQTLTDEQKAQARANIGVTDGESDVDAVLNNTRIIARDTGGFLAGSGASFSENGLTEDYTGGAIGKNASTTRGGSIGESSSSLTGGAVGYGANTQSGGAVGFNAKAYGSGFAGGEGAIAYRDAIQLGTGTNKNDKTLQVYDKNIYNANTDTLTVTNIEGNATSATKATQDGDGNVIKDSYLSLQRPTNEIPANADLNTVTYLNIGNYSCPQNGIVETLKNCPTTQAFNLHVLSTVNASNDSNSAWSYRVRIIIDLEGKIFSQYAHTSGVVGDYVFNNWKQMSSLQEVLPLTGGILTGNLTVKTGSDWGQYQAYSSSGHYRSFEACDTFARIDVRDTTSTTDRRFVDIYSGSAQPDNDYCIQIGRDNSTNGYSGTYVATHNWVNNNFLKLTGGTLTGKLTVKSSIYTTGQLIRGNNLAKGATPSSGTNWAGLAGIYTNQGLDTSNNQRLLYIEHCINNDNSSYSYIRHYENKDGTNNAYIRLGHNSSGTGIIDLSHSPATTDSSTKIATTAWVRTADAVALNTTRDNQHDTVKKYHVSQDGKTWYRIWASGWKECGGQKITAESTTAQQITLPVTFSNTNYTVLMNKGLNGTANAFIADVSVFDLTTNSFKTRGYNSPVRFYACGF